ncbi:transmembrane protein 169 [Pararge aegeria]|uniref:Jg12028 protein n=3 Tax=Pararge aegeria TaxID=116150 RepID=A0A8S4R5Y9_9NEOP|nr:transmembrane protein 169 [Pararge aegeria]CAH2230736.1 jg12028 [Pararge aegeria aegeria]
MAKVEQPIFILPKKRNGKKSITIAGHVDHIITVQGVGENELPSKYKNGLSPVSEHVVNGIIHSTMDGLKSNMKINLPIINDVNDEDSNETNSDQKLQKNGYQSLSTIHSSREIIDLSPIYENSSDACSSHGDLREFADSDMQRSCRVLNSDNNESSCPTPNSLSQTQSENSFEMGPLTDSLKNSAKRRKRVNIIPGIVETDNTDSEITALRVESEGSISPECSLSESRDGYLTMTGTIKRGKKKGQNVDVKLNISREELEIIEAAIVADEYNKMDVSKCSLYNGPHIFIFSLLCIPFVACISAMYSFYMGTMAWYNIFTHVTEDFSCIKKVLLAPIVILSYPFMIVIFTFGLGLFAGIAQLTFSGANWWKDVCDFEKGFYGWLCNTLGMSECSPYEVVVLMDVKP